MKRLEEKEVIKNILKICNEISTNSEIISFLGFVEGKYISCKETYLILKNSKTGEIWETTKYPDFINYKPKGSFRYHSTHQSFSNEKVIQKIINANNNPNWDYSKIIYKNNKTPVTIICNEIDKLTGKPHGEFHSTPLALFKGHGCPKCAETYSYTTEEFIERANIVHNGFYNYDKTIYKKAHEKIIVTCPIHGDFLTTPTGHLCEKYGCPICNNPKGETEIIRWLNETKINYDHLVKFDSKKFNGCPNKNFVEIDFVLYFKKRNIWIEFNGKQHYSEQKFFHENGQRTFSEQIQRDNSIREYAKDNNIEFLEIPWVDIDRIPEILEAFLYRQEDITTKIDIDYDNI